MGNRGAELSVTGEATGWPIEAKAVVWTCDGDAGAGSLAFQAKVDLHIDKTDPGIGNHGEAAGPGHRGLPLAEAIAQGQVVDALDQAHAGVNRFRADRDAGAFTTQGSEALVRIEAAPADPLGSLQGEIAEVAQQAQSPVFHAAAQAGKGGEGLEHLAQIQVEIGAQAPHRGGAAGAQRGQAIELHRASPGGWRG